MSLLNQFLSVVWFEFRQRWQNMSKAFATHNVSCVPWEKQPPQAHKTFLKLTQSHTKTTCFHHAHNDSLFRPPKGQLLFAGILIKAPLSVTWRRHSCFFSFSHNKVCCFLFEAVPSMRCSESLNTKSERLSLLKALRCGGSCSQDH